jgi:hypothetical protein
VGGGGGGGGGEGLCCNKLAGGVAVHESAAVELIEKRHFRTVVTHMLLLLLTLTLFPLQTIKQIEISVHP